MQLSRRSAGFLLAVAGWDVVIWLTFVRNLAADDGRPAAFYVVHAVLIVVNLAIAVGLGSLGWRAWRATSVPRGRSDADGRRRSPVTPAGRSGPA